MDILSEKKRLQEEINKCNKKLSELEVCISLNEKQINDITCKINRLNNELMILKSKKENILYYCDKVITILSLILIFPILLKISYYFLTFFGTRFMDTTNSVFRHGYGLVTLLGGGLITFGGPILMRDVVDNIVKLSFRIIINCSRYKNFEEKLKNTKKKLDDLNFSRCKMLSEKNDITFEYSKYSALSKFSVWLLNNIDSNLDIDDRNYDTKKTVRTYTRRREKDDFVKK